ncbi:chitinase [Paenactinomyces guangxiensis]|uniref:chitinase n=1 Tax=Paenactinomyces guangxiensis TaxID=1490290 RepID=A0A7W2AAJ8_9BACL|nr:glycosyl hydrolase family 18 protein [Paenactinomyces guangxiensis]MBA4496279.1 fibronectin type III domain-containing protein [Paenactinomyces guangxiensis]MBH8593332.1 fibronectin type III domain-containing protein [Paenactinomyces guangxiensis]
MWVTRTSFTKRSLSKNAFAIVVIVALLASLIPAGAFAAGAWEPNVAYAEGDIVTYAGSTYKCLQSHTSLPGWEPPNVPALWSLQSPGGGGEEDTQPPSAPANLTAPVKTDTSVSLSWTASTDNVGVSGYNIYKGSELAGTATGTSFTVTGLTPNTLYAFTVKAKDAAGNVSAASNEVTVTTNPSAGGGGGNGNKLLIGYWHNFDNGSANIRLRDVSAKFDVINVAFAEPTGRAPGEVGFTPYNATPEEFKSDIAYLNSIGKKVVISLGGANGHLQLNDHTSKENFINSMSNLIQTYGFNGIDIDLEGGSLSLAGGDTDFRNPKTPAIVNLISAVRTLCDRFGSDFVLSMAPETAYVQGGYTAYGGPWGAYLPVIYGLRDKLTYVHVQHYNSGAMTALDGRSYAQGTADFQVAMAEMLLYGFPVANNTNNQFPALREDQVAIGLPSTQSAAPSGGYTSPSEIQKALNYLVKGTSYGGAYKLRNPGGYAGFRGVMTWSINWDAASGYNFSTNVRNVLDSLSP